MFDRADLRKAARRAAKASCHPDFPVWWSGSKPRLYDGVRIRVRRLYGRTYFRKRNVKVPATWVLARLGGGRDNIAVRVRDADPRQRILSTPHWLDRVATRALACNEHWLTVEERAQVSMRADAIWRLRCRRSKPELEFMNVADIRVVGSAETGYALSLAGRCRHRWSHWPGRAEILRFVIGTREEDERQRCFFEKEAERHRARREAEMCAAPSSDAPDTLGWRGWRWDGQVLISPMQGTEWHDATLRVLEWADSAAVRGVAGIHARRLPRDWRRADPAATEIGHCTVHGIVERFGRYVLGTEGWRAEWVVIRELMAPDTETALALMRRYPEVKVHVREQEARP
jgi:hypothetical protein